MQFPPLCFGIRDRPSCSPPSGTPQPPSITLQPPSVTRVTSDEVIVGHCEPKMSLECERLRRRANEQRKRQRLRERKEEAAVPSHRNRLPSNRRRLPSNRRRLPSNRRRLPVNRRRLPCNRRRSASDRRAGGNTRRQFIFAVTDRSDAVACRYVTPSRLCRGVRHGMAPIKGPLRGARDTPAVAGHHCGLSPSGACPVRRQRPRWSRRVSRTASDEGRKGGVPHAGPVGVCRHKGGGGGPWVCLKPPPPPPSLLPGVDRDRRRRGSRPVVLHVCVAGWSPPPTTARWSSAAATTSPCACGKRRQVWVRFAARRDGGRCARGGALGGPWVRLCPLMARGRRLCAPCTCGPYAPKFDGDFTHTKGSRRPFLTPSTPRNGQRTQRLWRMNGERSTDAANRQKSSRIRGLWAGDSLTWGGGQGPWSPPPKFRDGGLRKGRGPQAYFLNANIGKSWLPLADGVSGGGSTMRILKICENI